MARYQELLAALRGAFPPPVSDPVHDGYVVFSLLRALDKVDSLKSQAPILGQPRTVDYIAAQAQQLAEKGHTTEEVIPELVKCLEGMLIWGHPRAQMNVVAHPSIASIIGVVLPSIYNPNLCSEESSLGFAEAEVRVAAMAANLTGYDPKQCGGLFTFGGTGTLLYGVKIGLEKAVPGALQNGLRQDVTVLTSDQGHYAALNVAAWLGIGQQNVVRIPTDSDNSMNIEALEAAARQSLAARKPIAAIIGTLGTTDAFGLDDLAEIHAVRERITKDFKLDYRPHIHADAVIGWAWSTFNQYDFYRNSLEFSGRTLRALAACQNRIKHLPLADSLGIDFHKTGFTPYISSLFLAKNRQDLGPIARNRDDMPYLFHSGEHHPGLYSLETSRSGAGPMSALASLLLLGKEGLATLLGHAVQMAEVLREMIAARPELTVVNDENFGPVTLFRAYPDGVDTFKVKEREMHDESFRDKLLEYNELNRRIYDRVHAGAMAGRGVAIGLTQCYRTTDYGEPIVALKSYVLSPFADETQMQTVVSSVLDALSEELDDLGLA